MKRILIYCLFFATLTSCWAYDNKTLNNTLDSLYGNWHNLPGMWIYQHEDTIFILNIDTFKSWKGLISVEGSCGLIINDSVLITLDRNIVPNIGAMIWIEGDSINALNSPNLTYGTLAIYDHTCDDIVFRQDWLEGYWGFEGTIQYEDSRHIILSIDKPAIEDKEIFNCETSFPKHMRLTKIKNFNHALDKYCPY